MVISQILSKNYENVMYKLISKMYFDTGVPGVLMSKKCYTVLYKCYPDVRHSNLLVVHIKFIEEQIHGYDIKYSGVHTK